jgi:hypothetical protein
MALVKSGGKNFEKPSAGIWLGRIIDVVQLGLVTPKNPLYPTQVKMRVFWVVAPVPGQGLNAVDSEGRSFSHMEEMPSKMTPPTKYQASKMYKLAEQVFGGADKIPVPFDDEFFMGRTNQLVLVTNGEYRNIAAAMPVPANLLSFVPAVPAGYVRIKDRPKQAGQTPTQAPVQQSVAPSLDIPDEDIPF